MIISYTILCCISDQKLLLKENSQNTKQVEYCELFETRRFGGIPENRDTGPYKTRKTGTRDPSETLEKLENQNHIIIIIIIFCYHHFIFFDFHITIAI